MVQAVAVALFRLATSVLQLVLVGIRGGQLAQTAVVPQVIILLRHQETMGAAAVTTLTTAHLCCLVIMGQAEAEVVLEQPLLLEAQEATEENRVVVEAVVGQLRMEQTAEWEAQVVTAMCAL
jgi:hypothetical protein